MELRRGFSRTFSRQGNIFRLADRIPLDGYTSLLYKIQPSHHVTISPQDSSRGIKLAFRVGEHVRTFGVSFSVALLEESDGDASLPGGVHVIVRTTVVFL